MQTLKTKRMLLRPIRWSDINDYNEYASKEEIGYLSGWRPHNSRMDTLMAISAIKSSQGFHFAVEYENKMIGTASLQEDDKRPGIRSFMLGYSLNPCFHNMGLGTELSMTLIEHAFKKGAFCVAAYCFPENAPSKRVLEKCGFSHEGCLKSAYPLYSGELKDVECFLLTKNEYEKK